MAPVYRETRENFATAGLEAASNGYHVLPIPAKTKKARLKNWTRFCRRAASDVTLAGWARAQADASVALACGWSVVAIDIDEEDHARAQAFQGFTELFLGPNPLIRFGLSPRRVLLYGVEGDEPISSCDCGPVQILGDGRYVMAFGIHPVTNQPFRWVGHNPASMPVASLATVTPARIRCFVEALELLRTPDRPKPAALTKAQIGSRSSEALRIRTHVTAPWQVENDLVVDRREAFLAHLVWRAACAIPEHHPELIADAAWKMFERQADLSRPRGGGSRLWTRRDALTKAKAIVSSERAQERLRKRDPTAFAALKAQENSGSANAFWNAAAKDVFAQRVESASARRKIPPSARTVSNLMLGLVHGAGACFASVETLAQNAELSIFTVKRARARLRAEGLWFSHQDKGGKGCIALYWPNPAILNDEHRPSIVTKAPQTVAISGTMIIRGGGGEHAEASDFDALVQAPNSPDEATYRQMEKEEYI